MVAGGRRELTQAVLRERVVESLCQVSQLSPPSIHFLRHRSNHKQASPEWRESRGDRESRRTLLGVQNHPPPPILPRHLSARQVLGQYSSPYRRHRNNGLSDTHPHVLIVVLPLVEVRNGVRESSHDDFLFPPTPPMMMRPPGLLEDGLGVVVVVAVGLNKDEAPPLDDEGEGVFAPSYSS
mmetsp:Transcript_37226/g.111437  ORF Transcript_37226/g.111437 Transcript_37226/m.111437 type:complete len:181 (-) Transcript_37226:988-1530(-)